VLTDNRDNVAKAEIARALRAIRRRELARILLGGGGGTVAVAVAGLLAVMAVDWQIVIFSDAARWALSLSALAAAALAAGVLIVRPLARVSRPTSLARQIERRHPELRERLSSAVELLACDDPPGLRGSDELIAALARRASLDAAGLDARREVSFRPARAPVGLAAGALAVLGALLSLWPEPAWLLVRRAFLANAPRVSEASIALTRLAGGQVKPWGRDGVDYVMLAGGKLQVELAVADRAVTGAEVRAARGAVAEAVTAMTRLADDPAGRRRFAVTLCADEGDLTLRFAAGDALTRRYRVRAVSRPAVRQIDVTLKYPDYTRRPDELRTDTTGDFAVVTHAVVTLRVHPSNDVARAEILVDGNSKAAAPRLAGGGASVEHTFELLSGAPYRWSVRMTDAYGFANPPRDHEIEVLDDRAPSARIVAPSPPRLRLRPNDKLPIAYAIADDFGLASASLDVEADGRKLPRVALTAGPATRPATAPVRATDRLDGMAVLDLAALDLKGVRRLTVRLRATDWLPPALGGPGRAQSKPLVIDIDSRAPSFAEQAAGAAKDRLAKLLSAAVEELKKARGDSAQLRRVAGKAERLPDSAVERGRRLGGHLALAEASLRGAIDANTAKPFGRIAPRLEDIADDHVAKARLLTGQMLLLDQREARGAAADEVDFEVNRAIALIDKMTRDLGPAASKAARELSPAGLAALAAGGRPGTRIVPGDGEGESHSAAAKLGIAAEDWARLPGRLRSQIAQAAAVEGPPEYRQLIRAYFQAVARMGAAPDRQKGDK